MKSKYKPLKDLTSKNKSYTIKVKVIHKGSPQKPENKSRYQRLLLEDEEGFKMKATLFNNDIEAFDEALQRNGEYEISNATVTEVPAQHATRTHEHALVINGRATIDPVPTDPSAFGPQYCKISSISRSTNDDMLYDVIGVILFTHPPRSIANTQGRANEVLEFRITDHSCERPIVVSLWNEIAQSYTQLAQQWPNTFTVIGLTALKTRGYKGFALCSTMSTSIIQEPQGSKADALRAWVAANESKLTDQQTKLVQLLPPNAKATQITALELQERKAHNTWQEEQFSINVQFANMTSQQLHLYLGCSKCGKRAISPPPTPKSPFSCKACAPSETKCVPRATLRAIVADETGEVEITMFTNEIEMITGITCDLLWKMKDEKEELEKLISELKKKWITLIVGPTLALSKSRALFWSVRAIELD